MQGELNFENAEGGYTQWFTSRRVAAQEMARRMNLPVGHQVEIWLQGGVRLRGQLRLQEEELFIEEERIRHLPLQIDRVAFTYREIDSCVRLD